MGMCKAPWAVIGGAEEATVGHELSLLGLTASMPLQGVASRRFLQADAINSGIPLVFLSLPVPVQSLHCHPSEFP